MSNFVHLHAHSEYSLLDGLPKIKSLVRAAKELGMTAIALTDHGNLYGAIEFYKECKAQNIKSLIGMEGYTVTGDHLKKEGKEDKENNHLILIAKNLDGWKNLMKITTIAHLEGYYYKPRVGREVLKKYSQGLICLSACPKSEIGRLLIDENYEKAKETASWFRETFGEENYFLEIQRHQYGSFLEHAKNNPKIADRLSLMQKNEDIWVSGLIKLSRELGIPLVATNDIHYLKNTDASAQDALVCISTGKNVDETERLRYVDAPTFYLRSKEEMLAIFSDAPDALTNTEKVASMADLEIILGKWFFPNIDIPNKTPAPEYLRELCQKKFPAKYPDQNIEINNRLEYELEIIITKGYAPYFLMMADMVDWCRELGIITNTRGSAAGSVVSYILGITNVDPIAYGLPFERFLNPFRPKPPDIDLDVADNRREELISYIVEKYGADKVAQICTFGRMLARAAVRDVGRVLGHPYSLPDKIAKLIPLGSQGFPMTIKHSLEISPELKKIYQGEPDARKILDLAEEIEGNARHASVHAAGVVVSPALMTEYTPLQLEPKGTKIITQFEMHACEDVGLVKFDILGIRNLSILQAAVEIIEKNHAVKINLDKIPLDDKKTFTMLSRGETMGVFQLGGSGMTKWLIELKPNRIEDLMVMIALFRPGPMANIPEYIARKNKKSAVTYLHPKMKKFLDKSYGILVYQEDILFTAIELAGYNWETVDKLRLAIGKKIPAEMAKQHDIFVKGCQDTSDISKEEGEKIWNLFVPFQGYGFNKAHAASYGIVSYQTAYLKAHYPVEYMTALLTAESGDADKIAQGVEECRRMKIAVLAPDINKSKIGFTLEKNENSLKGQAIRFGLSAIKNVGAAAIESILTPRGGEDFKNLADFCARVDLQKVNRKTMESLIKTGALDMFGKRAQMLIPLDEIMKKAHAVKKKGDVSQFALFDEKEESLFLKVETDFPEMDELPREEMLLFEKELLGFYLTEHPMQKALSDLHNFTSHRIVDLSAEMEGEIVSIGGLISNLRKITTKRDGKEMAFVTLEDLSGRIEAVIFPKIYEKAKKVLILDQVISIKGRIDNKDNTPVLLAESVFGLEEMKNNFSLNENFDKELEINAEEFVIIKIPANTNQKKLVKLNDLFLQNKGLTEALLYFEGGKKLKLPYGLNYNNLFEEKIKEIITDS